jgi:hypothetical protein
MNLEKIAEKVVLGLVPVEGVIISDFDSDREVFLKLLNAIKYKKTAQFSYTHIEKGVWHTDFVKGFPSRIVDNGKLKIVYVSGMKIPIGLIGDPKDIKRRYEERQKKKEQALSVQDGSTSGKMRQIVGLFPMLGKYLTNPIIQRFEINILWDILSSTRGGTVVVGKDKEEIGMVGRQTKMRSFVVFVEIRIGEPWDKKRVSLDRRADKMYLVDDEGNKKNVPW